MEEAIANAPETIGESRGIEPVETGPPVAFEMDETEGDEPEENYQSGKLAAIREEPPPAIDEVERDEEAEAARQT